MSAHCSRQADLPLHLATIPSDDRAAACRGIRAWRLLVIAACNLKGSQGGRSCFLGRLQNAMGPKSGVVERDSEIFSNVEFETHVGAGFKSAPIKAPNLCAALRPRVLRDPCALAH